LDGRLISMQVVLRGGGAAFTWKTAYDEALGDMSPNRLFEDYTQAFLENDQIDSVDSCAYRRTSFMAGWQERQAVADLMICAKRGPPTAMVCAGCLNRQYRARREDAKQIWQKARPRRSPPSNRCWRVCARPKKAPRADPNEVYPNDFRCEKLDGSQTELLQKMDLPSRCCAQRRSTQEIGLRATASSSSGALAIITEFSTRRW
jgi:Acetyltransferase (GNAT) domain